MKVPGSGNYLPVLIHNLETASGQHSYQYALPNSGYSYPIPKPATKARTRPAPSRKTPVRIPEPDERETEVDPGGDEPDEGRDPIDSFPPVPARDPYKRTKPTNRFPQVPAADPYKRPQPATRFPPVPTPDPYKRTQPPNRIPPVVDENEEDIQAAGVFPNPNDGFQNPIEVYDTPGFQANPEGKTRKL